MNIHHERMLRDLGIDPYSGINDTTDFRNEQQSIQLHRSSGEETQDNSCDDDYSASHIWVPDLFRDSPPNIWALDFEQEQRNFEKIRKIRHYSRTQRFKYTLMHLLNLVSIYPQTKNHVRNIWKGTWDNIEKRNFINAVKFDCVKKNIDYNEFKIDPWNAVRKSLKKCKISNMYNRIPGLIARLGGPTWKGRVSENLYKCILNDFEIFSKTFDTIKNLEMNIVVYDRIYFPNLRFIALSLLYLHDVKFPYKIPLTCTQSKYNELVTILGKVIKESDCHNHKVFQ